MKVVYPTLPKEFPLEQQVIPENVLTKAADGLEIHNQLFVPKDIKPGERRPALIFVHGGPVRQMLLGYHYMWFYHMAYAMNQWLTAQGYVVLSVNYRSGVGYGKSFRNAPNTGQRGNAEYQDVVAGAKYLQGRDDVDPKRVGIWGLSYGGLLTAQALARNSDIFVAGVDFAGVHLYTNVLDPENVAYKSSAISAIDTWKSPVLLVHGDDDRNVAFTQTTGLVQLLRARNIYHELIVFPDDVHESLIHKRWLYTFDRMEQFLDRFVRNAGSRSTRRGEPTSPRRVRPARRHRRSRAVGAGGGPGRPVLLHPAHRPAVRDGEGNADFEQETANLEFAVATANRLRPAFVIVTGDLVNRTGDAAQIAEYQRILAPLDPSIRSYSSRAITTSATNRRPTACRLHEAVRARSLQFQAWRFRRDRPGLRAWSRPQKAQDEAARQEQWLRAELARARRGSAAAHRRIPASPAVSEGRRRSPTIRRDPDRSGGPVPQAVPRGRRPLRVRRATTTRTPSPATATSRS